MHRRTKRKSSAGKSDLPRPASLAGIPADCLSNILSFLPHLENFRTLRRVCKHVAQVAARPSSFPSTFDQSDLQKKGCIGQLLAHLPTGYKPQNVLLRNMLTAEDVHVEYELDTSQAKSLQLDTMRQIDTDEFLRLLQRTSNRLKMLKVNYLDKDHTQMLCDVMGSSSCPWELEELFLTNTKLSFESFPLNAVTQNLLTLDVSNVVVTREQLCSLAKHCSKLRSLRITLNPISVDILGTLTSRFKRLGLLSVEIAHSDHPLHVERMLLEIQPKDIQQLQCLSITGNRNVHLTRRGVIRLLSGGNLRRLSLVAFAAETKHKDCSEDELTEIKSLPPLQLSHLHFRGVGAGELAADLLEHVPRLGETLDTLLIQDCFTPGGARKRILSIFAKQCSKLQELMLYWSPDDSDIELLCTSMPNLMRLSFSLEHDDLTIKCFASLRRLRHLQFLKLPVRHLDNTAEFAAFQAWADERAVKLYIN